jgi:cell division protein FtsZ
MEMIPENSFKSIIKVIGIGGGGSNAVKHMKEMDIKGADLVICNTDSQALASNPVQTKIKLGQQGLGAGTDPEVGRQAALESREKIQQVLSNDTQMVFITAGMGGGTGTGAAPVIAEIAREKNLLTVAVVTAPYKWEGRDKIHFAMAGVDKLKSFCDTVIVVMNDKLAEHYENLPMSDAFSKADDVLAKAVKSVVDVISKPGDINTDFMDVKKVLTNAGKAMMSSSYGEGENRAGDAIEEALKSPLLNSQEYEELYNTLLQIKKHYFYKVPQKTLLSNTYLKNRMLDYKPGIAGSSDQTVAGDAPISEETTHFSVVDPEGNMVAVTTTLNGGYGNRTVVGGAGFILNNEMDDFSAKPGSPNMYGAIGGEANSIAPHKRMLSSMTPTLLTKNNKPYLTVGTPGGTTIPTSVFQTIVNLVDFNMSLEDAINNPKFHHQWLPDDVSIEKTFNQNTKAAIEKMGYRIKERGSIGRTDGIVIGPTGKRITVADKRGDDAVAGF